MHRLLLFFTFLLALAIAGCQGGGDERTASSSAFIGGTQALAIDFVQSAPPAEITDARQFPFSIIVEVENVGEWDIGPVEEGSTKSYSGLLVNVSGLYPGDFTFEGEACPHECYARNYDFGDGTRGCAYCGAYDANGNCDLAKSVQRECPGFGFMSVPLETQHFNDYVAAGLRGVRKNPDGGRLAGERALVSFPDFAPGVPEEGTDMSYAPQLQGNIVLPVRADICYPYGTKVSAVYCLRADTTSAEKGVCSVNGVKVVENSAAPVHVISLQESAAGRGKLLFTFEIGAKGAGRILRENTACAAAYSNKVVDENVVNVIVDARLAFTDAAGFACSGLSGSVASRPQDGIVTGSLRLSAGTAVFTCTMDTTKIKAGVNDAAKEMRLTLSYDYLESKTTSVLVKRILG